MNKAHPVYQAAYAAAFIQADNDGASVNDTKNIAAMLAAEALAAYNLTLATDYPKLEVLARAAFEASKRRALERWSKDPDSLTAQVVKSSAERLMWHTMGEDLQQEWLATVAGILAMLPGEPLK